eukprot:2847097-Pyramimonas_sp.AAC.1
MNKRLINNVPVFDLATFEHGFGDMVLVLPIIDLTHVYVTPVRARGPVSMHGFTLGQAADYRCYIVGENEVKAIEGAAKVGFKELSGTYLGKLMAPRGM